MKTVIISGGSSGIGAATALHFSKAGYRVFILDMQPPTFTTHETYFISCDISNLATINSAVQEISHHCAYIDALVCNAGIHLSATLMNTTEQDFDRIMTINFKGAFFLTQAVLPLMLKQKKGAIVFVGSDQTLVAKYNSPVYGASKAALGSLAKTTALDYAKEGIRSNLVAPGTIDTPLYQKAIQNYCAKTGIAPEKVHIDEANEQPLGRIGQASEVANLIYFLCSDEAAFITGAIYPIDGGYTTK